MLIGHFVPQLQPRQEKRKGSTVHLRSYHILEGSLGFLWFSVGILHASVEACPLSQSTRRSRPSVNASFIPNLRNSWLGMGYPYTATTDPIHHEKPPSGPNLSRPLCGHLLVDTRPMMEQEVSPTQCPNGSTRDLLGIAMIMTP